MRRCLVVVLLSLLVALASCAKPTPTPPPTAVPTVPPQATAPKAPTVTAVPTTADLSGKISVAGSTTVQPLAEKLAEAFMAINPKVDITVQGGGSGVGVKSAGEGTVDVGTTSRELKAEELDTYKDLVVHTIAKDGIAVVVHKDTGVDGLTKEQVRDIFAGKIVNWKEVGGPDQAIVVVSREEGSGTRDAFQEMVMGKNVNISGTAILQNSNGAVRTTVAETPASIGYLSFGYLDQSVKVLKVNGVVPSAATALDGTYPIVRPLTMLTKGEPQGVVKAWLEYILGANGQKIVAEQGYIAVSR